MDRKIHDSGEPARRIAPEEVAAALGAGPAVKFRDLDDLGHPGYRVGDDGSVWKLNGDVWVPASTSMGGGPPPSPKVYLGYRNGRMVSHPLARLVLLAFRGPPPGKKSRVRWMNEDRMDCRVENLAWESHAQTATRLRPGMEPTDDGTLYGGIRRRIYEARRESGLSRHDASRRTGWDECNWSAVENGYHAPTLVTLLRIAASLGCQLGDLLPDDWMQRLPPIAHRKKGGRS